LWYSTNSIVSVEQQSTNKTTVQKKFEANEEVVILRRVKDTAPEIAADWHFWCTVSRTLKHVQLAQYFIFFSYFDSMEDHFP